MPVCSAAVSVSVNPVDGSNALRFERIPVAEAENKKEIHIRVVSSNGARFQVFQRILEPMMNEKGETINLQAIETQTLANSNSTGTLYLQNSDHLNMSDQLLYSSNQNGGADSFFIGYVINPNMVNANGTFRGKLVFTIRGNDGSEDEISVDVFLDLVSSYKMSIRAGHQPNRLHVHSTDMVEKDADFVNISFSGNGTQEIRIYQEVENMPQNGSEDDLGYGVLQLDEEGATDGLRAGGLTPFQPNRTLIYESNKDQDNFIIYFLVDTTHVQQQEAGTYGGRIKYIVQRGQSEQEYPIDLQMEVPAIFSMNITTPNGGVSFAHVLAINPPQDEQVIVTVVSNLHKPYQVFQDIESNMTNQQGKEFNSKYFTLQVQIPTDQKGRTDYVEFSPVQVGEYPVYSSDAQGSPTTFKVDYRLQGYPDMNPGNFTAPIRFSLNQK